MKKYIKVKLLIVSIILNTNSFSQSIPQQFNVLNDYWNKNEAIEIGCFLPKVYQDNDFTLRFNPEYIEFNKKEVNLKTNNQPISGSIIYKENLIALFNTGFKVYALPSLSQNAELEKKLNKKKFTFHYQYNNQLIAHSIDGLVYKLNEKLKWVKYNDYVISPNQHILHEDSLIFITSIFKGEWGSDIIIHNKTTQKTDTLKYNQTINSIVKTNNAFLLTSLSCHDFEHSDKIVLNDLKEFKTPIEYIHYYKLAIIGNYYFKDELYYIISWGKKTFIAKINSKVRKVYFKESNAIKNRLFIFN